MFAQTRENSKETNNSPKPVQDECKADKDDDGDDKAETENVIKEEDTNEEKLDDESKACSKTLETLSQLCTNPRLSSFVLSGKYKSLHHTRAAHDNNTSRNPRH